MNAKELFSKIDAALKKYVPSKGKNTIGTTTDKNEDSGFTYPWQKEGYWKGIKPGKNPNAEHHEGDGG